MSYVASRRGPTLLRGGVGRTMGECDGEGGGAAWALRWAQAARWPMEFGGQVMRRLVPCWCGTAARRAAAESHADRMPRAATAERDVAAEEKATAQRASYSCPANYQR